MSSIPIGYNQVWLKSEHKSVQHQNFCYVWPSQFLSPSNSDGHPVPKYCYRATLKFVRWLVYCACSRYWLSVSVTSLPALIIFCHAVGFLCPQSSQVVLSRHLFLGSHFFLSIRHVFLISVSAVCRQWFPYAVHTENTVVHLWNFSAIQKFFDGIPALPWLTFVTFSL